MYVRAEIIYGIVEIICDSGDNLYESGDNTGENEDIFSSKLIDRFMNSD